MELSYSSISYEHHEHLFLNIHEALLFQYSYHEKKRKQVCPQIRSWLVFSKQKKRQHNENDREIKYPTHAYMSIRIPVHWIW